MDLLNKLQCFAGHHELRCHTPVDEHGNFIGDFLAWKCEHCEHKEITNKVSQNTHLSTQQN